MAYFSISPCPTKPNHSFRSGGLFPSGPNTFSDHHATSQYPKERGYSIFDVIACWECVRLVRHSLYKLINLSYLARMSRLLVFEVCGEVWGGVEGV